MSKTTWQVTENNGGGLTLYVWIDDKLVFAHAGYEYTSPDQLNEDLDNLKKGANPIADGWDDNDLTDEDIIKGVRQAKSKDVLDEGAFFDGEGNIIQLTMEEYYDDHESTKVICDQNGPVAEDKMGNAGSKIFYPEGE